MSLNLYELIIKAAEENNINVNLEEIGRINEYINKLLSREINSEWIKGNIEILL
ncbi:hypothetical protein psyc5s11_36760 [Clostridium gelidum]|uniref:Uncharacterized protein n=1 Tax=Clostridium gelidum TaxID=704125 RepID=A0ABM7T8Y4_9CLOT|nr:hypothetical protein [Clostridium gelidum]BCZ47609.1 hypothetical protein psyc5s11_36760 [Clostridium gelidum]